MISRQFNVDEETRAWIEIWPACIHIHMGWAAWPRRLGI